MSVRRRLRGISGEDSTGDRIDSAHTGENSRTGENPRTGGGLHTDEGAGVNAIAVASVRQ